jgi:CDP-paratose 2-epimerase
MGCPPDSGPPGEGKAFGAKKGETVKVLVTGGCGFLGSHTCEFFRNQGWDVVSYDNMTKFELDRTGYRAEAAREYNFELLEGLGVTMVRADVRNLEELLDRTSGCDFVVHTAAQPAVTISIEDPLLDLSTNVLGTVNVLEAARRHKIPVVSCATIHVYGNWVNDTLSEGPTRYRRNPPAVAEDAPTMEGYLTPLHASKSAGEQYVRTYASTYGLRAGSFRLTGLYGSRQLGGEDHGWVANFSIRNVIGWPITIFGTGKQVRDIVYATDVADAFLRFFERGEAGVYNIGGGEAYAISLVECIELIDGITGRKSDVRYEKSRFGDLKYFVCDCRKAGEVLGWKPTIEPRSGVRSLIEWVEQNRELFAA